MLYTGAEIVLKVLRNLDVEYIFGYPGGAILPIYDEIFKQNKIRHILVRHNKVLFIWQRAMQDQQVKWSSVSYFWSRCN